MKVFGVIGGAILAALLMISIYTSIHKPETNNRLKANKEYWQRMMCAQPRYWHLDQCKKIKDIEGITP